MIKLVENDEQRISPVNPDIVQGSFASDDEEGNENAYYRHNMQNILPKLIRPSDEDPTESKVAQIGRTYRMQVKTAVQQQQQPRNRRRRIREKVYVQTKFDGGWLISSHPPMYVSSRRMGTMSVSGTSISLIA